MKQFFCLLAMFAAMTSYAQKTLSKEYGFTASQPYRVIDADDKYYFSHDNSVVTVKIDKRDIYVQKFDAAKPAFVSEKQYEDAFPKNAVIETLKFINGDLYMFLSQWDGDNEIEQLLVQKIDFGKGEFSGEPKMLLQVKGRVTGNGSGRVMDFNLRDKFIVYPSFDKSNFLVKYRKKPEVKRDTKSFDVIGLVAYDGDMNKLSSRELAMPYTERRMNNMDFQLDNKGNVFMLNKIFHDDSNDDKKKKKDTVANYHIEVFTLKPGSDKFNVSKIENNHLFINALWIFDTPKGDLIAGGYFSNGKGKDFTSNCDGIVTFKMKADGSVYDQFTYDIPVALINEYESNKTKRKNEKKEEKGEGAKFTDLKLKDLKVQDDGSILMVGEQDFIVSHYSAGMNGSGGRTYYTYHYNDILVTKINPGGKLSWMKKIPKQQIGTAGRGGMSYQYFSNETDHFLVFLDNVKNIGLPVDKEPAKHSDGKGGYLTAVKLSDADGSFTKGSILNARDVEDFKLHQISMDRIVKTGENSFVMEAYKKKKEDVMIKVELK